MGEDARAETSGMKQESRPDHVVSLSAAPPGDPGGGDTLQRMLRVGFARAAVELADAGEHTDAARHAALDAGAALVRLAEAGDESALRVVLRPDPQRAQVTWSVACYQIGDLTPSALRDFPAATDAVAELAHCSEVSHVAAELLACDDRGLRWPALVRTGDDVSFQLPTERIVAVGTDADGELDDALAGWDERLARWSSRPDRLDDHRAQGVSAGPVAEPPEPPGVGRPDRSKSSAQSRPVTVGSASVSLPAEAPATRAELARLEERLSRLEARLAGSGQPDDPAGAATPASPLGSTRQLRAVVRDGLARWAPRLADAAETVRRRLTSTGLGHS
jgi:hypothetical protein